MNEMKTRKGEKIVESVGRMKMGKQEDPEKIPKSSTLSMSSTIPPVPGFELGTAGI